MARFRREAQAIARLVHPNIVQVYDFGVDEENNPYFVMELIAGMPLDRLLGSQGKLDPALALGYLRQAADGLAAAHRAGIQDQVAAGLTAKLEALARREKR